MGQRIRLVRMPDDPDPIPIGAMGTVIECAEVFGDWQVEVRWDNGRSLALVVPPDVAVVVA